MIDIQKAIGFTTLDLDTNSHGHLTDGQRRSLKRQRSETLIPLLLLLVFVCPIFLPSARDLIIYRIGLLNNVMGVLIPSGLVLYALSYVTPKWRKISLDLQNNKICSVIGEVLVEVTSVSSRHVHYNLIVGEMEFRIPEKLRGSFIKGEPYRVYYVPISKTIVSVEMVNMSLYDEVIHAF